MLERIKLLLDRYCTLLGICSNFFIKCIFKFIEAIHKTIKFIQSYIVFIFSFLFLFHFLMLYGTEQNIISLLVAKPVVQKRINYPPPTHKVLTSNTTWNHLIPCGVYFNEIEEMNTALQCANKKVYIEDPIDESTVIPRCFIISSASPDVYHRKGYNFIFYNSFFGSGGVVGYFDTDTDTVFVVENEDARKIYRHELQHFFLKLKGGTGGGHHQEIWKQCEAPYYEESERVKLIHKLEKLEKLEEMESSSE